MINEANWNVGSSAHSEIHHLSRQQLHHLAEERVVLKKRKASEDEVEDENEVSSPPAGEAGNERFSEEECQSGVSWDWEHGVSGERKLKLKRKKKRLSEEDSSTVTSLEVEDVERFQVGSSSGGGLDLELGDEEMMMIVEEDEEVEVESPTYVLSSGRSIRQLEKQKHQTIDDEFEDYFRQLML